MDLATLPSLRSVLSHASLAFALLVLRPRPAPPAQYNVSIAISVPIAIAPQRPCEPCRAWSLPCNREVWGTWERALCR